MCDRSLYGHAWYPDTEPWRPTRTFIIRNVSFCQRCGTYRFSGMNAYGEIESRYYNYPEGWRERWQTLGDDRPPTEELRRLWFGEDQRRDRVERSKAS